MTDVIVKWIAQFPKDSEFTILELNNGQKIYRENKSGFLTIPPDTKVKNKSRAALLYQEIIKLQEKRKSYESQLITSHIKHELNDDIYVNSYNSIKEEITQINKQIKEYENLL